MNSANSASDTNKENSGELMRFLVSGGSAVACDTTVYALLFPLLSSPSTAKAISFIAGTILAYLLNKFWTFKKPRRSGSEVAKFMCLYLSTLGANVAVNRLTLDHAPSMVPALEPYAAQFAFLAATGTSTVLNFLGQKFWVFRSKEEQ